MSFTIFDIPEVIDRIAHHLTPHDLSICIRVNKTWHKDFLRPLHTTIHTYDFDFNYFKHNEWPAFDPDRYEDLDPEGDRFGRHKIAQHAHLIRSFTTRSLKSLIDLGPGCVNLRKLSYGDSDDFWTYPDWCGGDEEWMGRSMEFGDQATETWVGLLKRNPKLEFVKVTFGELDDQKRIVEALGELKYLKELVVHADYDVSLNALAVEWVLQTCRHLSKVTFGSEEPFELSSLGSGIPWDRLENNSSIQEVVFDRVSALPYLRLLPSLKSLKLLNLQPSGALQGVGPILGRYCPQLQHLAFHHIRSPGIETLLQHCPHLSSLTFANGTLESSVGLTVGQFCPGVKRLELHRMEGPGVDTLVENCPHLTHFTFSNALLESTCILTTLARDCHRHTLRHFTYQSSAKINYPHRPYLAPEARLAFETDLIHILEKCQGLESFRAFALFDIDHLKALSWSCPGLKELGLSVDFLGNRAGKGPLREEPIEVQNQKVGEMLDASLAHQWKGLQRLELYHVPGGLDCAPKQVAEELSGIRRLIWRTGSK